ncbi:glycosyltransferase family 4 protein [candidate division KSB1 bacterium]|nr:glycosyltransferase family 4 protein [candidate division KSB1 bacterium]
MNILYLSAKKKWGGVVTWQVRTAQELEKRGHRVWMISNKDSSLSLHAPDDIHLLPVRTGMDFNPFLIAFLLRFIKKNDIELMATNIKKEVIAGGLAARLCRIPSVRFIGNEKDVDDSRRLQQYLVDQYIFPCHTCKELAQRKNPWLGDEVCRVIHIGHNRVIYTRDEVAAQRKQWGVPMDGIVVGFTGRLVRSKGIESLIKAFAEIASRRPQARLVITGEGKHRAEFQNLAHQLHLAERIIFTGFVPDPMLSAAAYDIAVLPSHYEAFPYTIVEYLAVGRPVVATGVGGVHEIISDGENGLIVQVQNVAQLSERILRLIDDPELRGQFSTAAARTIDRTYSEDRMIDQFEQFYQNCISQ